MIFIDKWEMLCWVILYEEIQQQKIFDKKEVNSFFKSSLNAEDLYNLLFFKI